MTSIAKQVWQYIDEDPSIRKDLGRGILNVSGLAAFLKDQGISGSLDSLISAIRRYKLDSDVFKTGRRIEEALEKSTVTTKTGVTAIWLRNSSNLYKYISELMRDPDFFRSEIFRLIKGREETLCMVEVELMRKAKSYFPAGNIVRSEEGLGELRIGLTDAGWEVPGLLARVANEIANYGVNIVVITSAMPHIRIFVKQQDLPKAHEAVLSLCERRSDQ